MLSANTRRLEEMLSWCFRLSDELGKEKPGSREENRGGEKAYVGR